MTVKRWQNAPTAQTSTKICNFFLLLKQGRGGVKACFKIFWKFICFGKFDLPLQYRVWRIYSKIQIFEYFWSEYLFGYSFVSFFGYEYIHIFVCVNFLDTNIFGYSFVARFWYEYVRIFVGINFQDTHRFLWILYFVYGYFDDNNDQKCYLDCKSTERVPV